MPTRHGSPDLTKGLREHHVFLHAEVKEERTKRVFTICVDSIDERGLDALCKQAIAVGNLVLVTLRGDVEVRGSVIRSQRGRLAIAFRAKLDLQALLHHPRRDADLCEQHFIPEVASRAWRPGIGIKGC